DPITNTVTVSGAVIDRVSGVPTGAIVDDNSAASITIVAPDLVKGIYAINGDPTATGPQVAPGDVVTYRVRTTLPLTNTYNTSLTDFLPLPTFDIPAAGFATDFVNPTPPGPFPADPWSLARGPDDTFTGA